MKYDLFIISLIALKVHISFKYISFHFISIILTLVSIGIGQGILPDLPVNFEKIMDMFKGLIVTKYILVQNYFALSSKLSSPVLLYAYLFYLLEAYLTKTFSFVCKSINMSYVAPARYRLIFIGLFEYRLTNQPCECFIF